MIFKTRTPPSEWCSKRQAPPRGHGQRTVFFPSLPRPLLSRLPAPLSHSGHYVTLFPECDSWQPLFSAGRGLLLIQACTLEGRRGLMCLPSDGPQLPFSPSLLPRDPVALQSDDTCGGGAAGTPHSGHLALPRERFPLQNSGFPAWHLRGF